MITVRLRTRVSARELEEKKGKVVGDDAYNLLLTGPARVLLPDGRPLAVYLPGVMREAVTEEQAKIFATFRRAVNGSDRGMASASVRVRAGNTKRKYPMRVASNIVGAFDPAGQSQFCRLTSWTGRNFDRWEALHPLFDVVAEQMRLHVPERYAAQQGEIDRTHPDWVIPGTPFTTVTINNTYPTGVHTDKGDLDKGFSTIFVVRRGPYTGGVFVFPEWRVAVDLQDGDLVLMDAHQWHGNTPIICACGLRRTSWCPDCGAERTSVVSYMRTRMVDCGSETEEIARAAEWREKTKGASGKTLRSEK